MTETVEIAAKQVLPEVKRYADARNAYVEQLRKLRDESDNLYYERHTSDEAMEAYQKSRTAWQDADKQRYAHYEKLIATLAEETEDKLVKYVAEHWLDEYHEQAILILEALPAPLAELDKIAKDHGWCGTWGDAVDGAAQAGAIEMTDVERVTRKLERFLNYEMGQYDTKRAMDMVNELVEARVQETLTARIEKALNEPEPVSE